MGSNNILCHLSKTSLIHNRDIVCYRITMKANMLWIYEKNNFLNSFQLTSPARTFKSQIFMLKFENV